MRTQIMKVWAYGLAILVSGHVAANVNVNNGNYYVANTDFYLPTAGLNFEIARTYNSRSSYVNGYFGIGWASEIEGHIKVEANKIDYFEGGGGNIVSFQKQKDGSWANSLYGLQTIKLQPKTGKYVLKSAVGKIFSFNKQGKMTSIRDVNGNVINIQYENGLVSSLQDNFNNQVRVSWKTINNIPRITRVERDELKAVYSYDKLGNLTKVVDAEAVPYQYEYDDEHNMTKITYSNGEYKAMSYNKSRDWVTKYRDRSGIVTEYDYFSDSLEPENKFGTVVARYAEGSRDRQYSKFWYEFRKRADGSRYNYRSVTSVGGVVTETLFTECCGTPLVISQWRDDKQQKATKKLDWTIAKSDKTTTSFAYYSDGLLKQKTSPDGTVTALTYDQKHKKVSSVKKGDRSIAYKYDRKGNLVTAIDANAGRTLNMKYDLQGRITVVNESIKLGKVAQAKQVFFRYDGNGRPIEIKEKSKLGEGTIQMQYGANGEVVSVLNKQGRAIASERDMATARGVFMTFQNLLEIVQPAGVTLGPEG